MCRGGSMEKIRDEKGAGENTPQIYDEHHRIFGLRFRRELLQALLRGFPDQVSGKERFVFL